MSPKGKSYRTGNVTVYVDYGYDVHSITFSGRTYERVRSGKPVTIKGQGFHWDGEPDQDVWRFNSDGRGVQSPNALYVDTYRGGEIYVGHLDDKEVWVDIEATSLDSSQ